MKTNVISESEESDGEETETTGDINIIDTQIIKETDYLYSTDNRQLHYLTCVTLFLIHHCNKSLRYLKSTLLLQIPRHITTVIHLLHISHFLIFLRQMAAAKNLMKVKAKIS